MLSSANSLLAFMLHCSLCVHDVLEQHCLYGFEWTLFCMCTRLFRVLMVDNMLELQSHVCECMLLCRCTCHHMFYLKRQYVHGRGRDLPSDWARHVGGSYLT